MLRALCGKDIGKLKYVLFLSLALVGCSEPSRSHLFVKVCTESYRVDDVQGSNLTKLLRGANDKFISVQILYPEFIDEDRLMAAKSEVHHFAKSSVVFVNKSIGLKCSE